MGGVSGYDVECVAIQISDYFLLKGFQTFWGVHWGSDKRDKYWHIHVAVNTINGMTGERCFAAYDDRNELKKYLKGYSLNTHGIIIRQKVIITERAEGYEYIL